METNKVTRVEVIDHTGRAYTNWNVHNKVLISMQDDDRTLKIFIDRKEEEVEDESKEVQ